MLYVYSHTLEKCSDSSVNMFCKLLHFKTTEISPEDYKTIPHIPCTPILIKVENIFSPVLLLPVKSLENLLLDVIKFTNDNKIECTIEKITKKNYFYSELKENIQAVRVSQPLKDFNSPHLKKTLTEFHCPVENLTISRNIKGPSLLQINGYTDMSNNTYIVSNMAEITFKAHTSFPQFRFMSVSIDRIENTFFVVSYDIKNGMSRIHEKNSGEIISDRSCNESSGLNPMDLSRLAVNSLEFLGYLDSSSKIPDSFKGKVFSTRHLDSKTLFNHLNAIIKKNNPDVIIHHGCSLNGVDLSGRIVCDSYSLATGLVKGRKFSVEELRETLLSGAYKGEENESDLSRLRRETHLLKLLVEKMDALELYKNLSEVCGFSLNRTLMKLQAERIEFLLLHELYARGCIFPPKRKKEADIHYTGGLVLTPKLGFYETCVLLLDFNSLYPSIIKEYNVCFSTVGKFNHQYKKIIEEKKELGEQEILFLKNLKNNKANDTVRIKEKDNYNPLTNEMPGEESYDAILPTIIRNLLARRKKVKDLMKRCTPGEYNTLDTRQKALKLTANSIYGCLGANISRFYNVTMASFITTIGREILMQSKRIAENELKLNVIYGDTDSIMIECKELEGRNENKTKSLECVEQLKDKINQMYKNIEIEVDRIFKKLIIYSKKKYAGLVFKKEEALTGGGVLAGTYVECKGLDTSRRDFCPLSNRIMQGVIDIMLEDQESVCGKFELNNGSERILAKIYRFLLECKNKLEKEPVKNFLIDVVLSRNPEDYKSPEALPHVALALRLNERGYQYRKDDVISYIVGDIGEKKANVSKRVFHPSESPKIDYEYYIENQVVCPLLRLLAPFKKISHTKIHNIFEVEKKFNKSFRLNYTILTPCCNHAEDIKSIECTRCKKEIPEDLKTYHLLKLLHSHIKELHREEYTCSNCEKNQLTLKICPECNKPANFEKKNENFDKKIEEIYALVEDKNTLVKEKVEEIYEISEYRSIDIKKYFT